MGGNICKTYTKAWINETNNRKYCLFFWNENTILKPSARVTKENRRIKFFKKEIIEEILQPKLMSHKLKL